MKLHRIPFESYCYAMYIGRWHLELIRLVYPQHCGEIEKFSKRDCFIIFRKVDGALMAFAIPDASGGHKVIVHRTLRLKAIKSVISTLLLKDGMSDQQAKSFCEGFHFASEPVGSHR